MSTPMRIKEDALPVPFDFNLHTEYLSVCEIIDDYIQEKDTFFKVVKNWNCWDADSYISNTIKWSFSPWVLWKNEFIEYFMYHIDSEIFNHIYKQCVKGFRLKSWHTDPLVGKLLSDPNKNIFEINNATKLAKSSVFYDSLLKNINSSFDGDRFCNWWFLCFWDGDIEIVLEKSQSYNKTESRLRGDCSVWNIFLLKEGGLDYSIQIKYKLEVKLNIENIVFVEF